MIDYSNATPDLFAALALAQGEVENASKSSNNPHFRSKYADLAEVLNTVRPVFAKHGLSIMQATAFDGALVRVSTLIGHKGGGLVVSEAACVPAKTDAQGIGAATTYLRRYSLAAMGGIAQEDDDGNTAAHNGKPTPVKAEGQPTSGVWEAQDAETQAGLLKCAATIGEFIEAGDTAGAWEFIERQAFNTDEKAALWTRLDSKTRTALKKAHEARRAA